MGESMAAEAIAFGIDPCLDSDHQPKDDYSDYLSSDALEEPDNQRKDLSSAVQKSEPKRFTASEAIDNILEDSSCILLKDGTEKEYVRLATLELAALGMAGEHKVWRSAIDPSKWYYNLTKYWYIEQFHDNFRDACAFAKKSGGTIVREGDQWKVT